MRNFIRQTYNRPGVHSYGWGSREKELIKDFELVAWF